MSDCPHCGSRRQDTGRICASCGYDFITQTTPYSERVALQIPGLADEIVLTPTELMVMSHAVEDWWGLWEIPPGNYQPVELAEASDPQALLQAAMRHLVELGLVELGWEEWASSKPPTLASPTDAIGLIEDADHWAAAQESNVVFCSTDLGYRSMLRGATRTIYVELLDEGVDVWRPVEAEPLGGRRYRLIAPDDYDPEAETWAFLPGAIVRCSERILSEGRVTVAIEEVGSAP